MSKTVTLEGFLLNMSQAQKESADLIRKMMIDMNEKLSGIENFLANSQEEKILDESMESQVKVDEDTEEDVMTQRTLPMLTLKSKLEVSEGDTEDGEWLPSKIVCHDCSSVFIRGSGEFSRHVKSSHCKPYQCHCGKLFKKKSSLNTHMTIHSKETFECDCGAVFRCKQYLNVHKRRKHSMELDAPEAKRICKDEENNEQSFDASFDPMDLLKMQMEELESPNGNSE